MKCTSCGHENRQAAQFCQGCGAVLASTQVIENRTDQSPSRKGTHPLNREAGSQRPTVPLTDTHPLIRASSNFAPLPEGALLHEGQYAVMELRATNEHLNTYGATLLRPIRVCTNCQTQARNLQDRFCSSCGADLSNMKPVHLRYLIQESSDAEAFAVEAQLLEMQLAHPGLLLPHDIFVESPYGPPRHYQVESDLPLPLASSLSVPLQLNRVLEWGVSLARAMDYLHHHQVTLREAALNQIALSGKKAQWIHVNRAFVISPEARSTAESFFTEDVRRLAEVLAYLATGPQRAIPSPIPEQSAAAFSKALAGTTEITAVDFATALDVALQALRHPVSVTLSIGQRTDVGQERSLNEDSLLTLGTSSVYRSAGTPVGLFAVADGMGGHSAGDVASQLTIQALEQRAVSEVLSPSTTGESLPDPRQWIANAVQAANQSVHDHRKTAGTDMGTTLVIALVVGNVATIGNVGDSRAYLLCEDGIAQITTDHSLVERLVATGQITKEEAAYHPQRNVIYRVIGDKPRTEPDLFEQPLASGEALLLCSDGLSGMIPDDQMWRTWRAATSPQEACDQLVDAANQAGGMDNITAVIVQVAG